MCRNRVATIGFLRTRAWLPLLALLTPVACDDGPGIAPPDQPALVEGTITALNAPWSPAPGALLIIQVAEDSGNGSALYALSILDDTRLLLRRHGRWDRCAMSELREQRRVRAWVSGAVLDSHPIQATAHTIAFLD